MKKMELTKVLKLVLYTVIIISITISLTICVIKNKKEKSSSNPNLSKVTTITKSFDKFFAFGVESLDLIINTNLISDEDKDTLKEYKNTYGNIYCNIHMGTVGGKDLVKIGFLDTPKKSFTFNANLNYKFEDIIKKFEEQSNFTLTNDFLTKSKFDFNLNKEMAGIIISFQNIDGVYCPYYSTIIDGKIYII